MNSESKFFSQLEQLIRIDPGRRGLLSEANSHWCAGDLERACRTILTRPGAIAIVTGFAIPLPDGPVAETDGPPGAVLLAEVLSKLGRDVVLVTDRICANALEVAAATAGLSDVEVEAMPVEPGAADDWAAEFLQQHQPEHLISIERVGPSHTEASVLLQSRSGSLKREQFEARVPAVHRNRVHNMRGELIDEITAPLHLLFEKSREMDNPPATVGIGDGGNEIGLGSIAWEDIAARLTGPQADWLPCRIATDCTILAGVSNWGGMALAAGVARLAGKPDLALAWTVDRQRQLIEDLVNHGPAVDGATRQSQPTVDGLTFPIYFGPWCEIERLLCSSHPAILNPES